MHLGSAIHQRRVPIIVERPGLDGGNLLSGVRSSTAPWRSPDRASAPPFDPRHHTAREACAQGMTCRIRPVSSRQDPLPSHDRRDRIVDSSYRPLRAHPPMSPTHPCADSITCRESAVEIKIAPCPTVPARRSHGRAIRRSSPAHALAHGGPHRVGPRNDQGRLATTSCDSRLCRFPCPTLPRPAPSEALHRCARRVASSTRALG